MVQPVALNGWLVQPSTKQELKVACPSRPMQMCGWCNNAKTKICMWVGWFSRSMFGWPRTFNVSSNVEWLVQPVDTNQLT